MGTGRVGWLATEIIEYIDDRVAERSTAVGTLGSDSTLIAEAAHPQRADAGAGRDREGARPKSRPKILKAKTAGTATMTAA